MRWFSFVANGPRVQEIPLNRILSNPFQPRKEINEEGLQRLMHSIAENGLVVPVIVRTLDRGRNYELVAGQRRVQACRRLNWKRVPALVRPLSDREVTQISLLENLQRAELSAVEVAETFERLAREYVQTDRGELAKKLGLDPAEVASQGQLLTLSVVTREAVMTGMITERHARALLPLAREEDQIRVLRQIHREDLSVRQTSLLVQRILAEREAEAGRSARAATPSPAASDPDREAVDALARELARLREGNGFTVGALERIAGDLERGLQADAAGALGTLSGEGRIDEPQSRIERHMLRVARVALFVARHAGWPEGQRRRLGVASLLYDVGLHRVDPALLARRGPLSPAEQTLVRRHVDYAHEMLSARPEVEPEVLRAVREHHERCDGSGYPSETSGGQIGAIGRLLGLADAFVAMCERRPHREGYTPYRAIQVLRIEADRGVYDREILEQFVRALSWYPVGSRVVLSDNRAGRVVGAGASPDRPRVEVEGGDVVELSAASSLAIRWPGE